MDYRQLRPRPPLDRFVDSIWIQENWTDPGPDGWEPTRILPTGKLDMVFFYADPFVQLTAGGELPLPRFSQTGQWTSPVDVKATGRSGVIIFSFFPWGIYPFCQLPLSELTNQHLALDEIFTGPRFQDAMTRLEEATSPIDRVRRVESWLCQALKAREHDVLVELAVRKINSVGGQISIRQLADELHLCRRQLGRRFRRTVGVSPKTFARINRFQKALGLKRLGWDWGRIVARCGFSDQSHFIREMRAFSGFSPEQIWSGRAPTPLSRHFNHCPEMSHFFNTIYL